MKNKVFKYIKVFISVALIFSLVAPSYASLSASDGSAFVTKAEFDSALADFNSRLTTFEAGINSKIDSQVTSYLDRNGIWNGKKQNLNSICNYGLLNNLGNSKISNDYLVTDNWLAVLYGNETRPRTQKNYLQVQGTTGMGVGVSLVDQITKTGLAYFKWRIVATNAAGKLNANTFTTDCGILWMEWKKEDGYSGDDAWETHWETYICFNQTESKELSQQLQIAEGNSWSDKVDKTQNLLVKTTFKTSQAAYSGIAIFFVNKGAPLYLNLLATGGQGVDPVRIYATSNKPWNWCRLVIDDISVY